MVLTEIISKYLQSNRRITIPALGTLLSKGDGTPLLFSEFMKDDDGILRELLSAESGMSELEAAVFVDRFVFDLRHTVESGERYAMPMLGYMTKGEGHSFCFEYDPSVVVIEQIEAEPAPTQETAAEELAAPEAVATAEQTAEQEEAPEAAEYVETPAGEPTALEGGAEPEPKSDMESGVEDLFRHRGSEMEPQESGTDWWMVAGIIGVVIAIAAVSYGIVVQWMMGNVSFGEPIDGVIEQIVSRDAWRWLHGVISASNSVSQEITPEDIIPKDTIYLKR